MDFLTETLEAKRRTQLGRTVDSFECGTLGALVERIPVIAIVVDADLRVMCAVGGGLAYVPLDPIEARGRDLLEVCAATAVTNPLRLLVESAADGTPCRGRLLAFDRCYDASVEPVWEGVDVSGVLLFVSDITESRDVRQALRATEHDLERAQRLAHLGSWDYDCRTRVLTCSAEMLRLFSFDEQQDLDAFLSRVHEDDRGAVLASLNAAFLSRERRAEDDYSLAYRVTAPSGQQRWIRQQIATVRDATGRTVRMNGIVQDHTDLKGAEERLRELATFDTLTRLPNRLSLTTRLAEEVRNAVTTARRFAVLFVDVDAFKRVNDTLGHAAGDRLLKAVACSLTTSVGPDSFVARSGGDEFVVIAHYRDRKEIERLAREIGRACARPFSIDGREIYSSVSIGISLCPEDANSADSLLRDADTAMYSAKNAGRNTYRFFAARMNEHAVAQLALENAFHRAIEHDALSVQYQPIFARDSSVRSLEALARWTHPALGPISPAVFVPIAEGNGTILALGSAIARRACREFKPWRLAVPTLRLGLNLSANQLDDENLIPMLESALVDADLDFSALDLEVTESAVMRDADAAIATLAECKSRGASVSIDDFGTGYSSLGILKRLPVDCVKIDRSFVRDLPEDREDKAIVSAIVAMSHALGLRVVAEGVETEEQAAFLHALGCDAIQGFLYSAPRDAAHVYEILTGVRARSESGSG